MSPRTVKVGKEDTDWPSFYFVSQWDEFVAVVLLLFLESSHGILGDPLRCPCPSVNPWWNVEGIFGALGSGQSMCLELSTICRGAGWILSTLAWSHSICFGDLRVQPSLRTWRGGHKAAQQPTGKEAWRKGKVKIAERPVPMQLCRGLCKRPPGRIAESR